MMHRRECQHRRTVFDESVGAARCTDCGRGV